MLAPLVFSSAIESTELNSFDPSSWTDVGIRVERIVDPRHFQAGWIGGTANDNDPSLLRQSDTPDIDQALSRLRKFKTWKDNWDGEGGKTPDPVIIDKAISLLSLLVPTRLKFGVGLDAESQPMFNLRNSSYDGHIVIERGGTISFFFQRREQALGDDDLPFDGRTLPGELAQVLPVL